MTKTILIIDDEADVRTFLAAVLKKHGYETATAGNGHEGLEVARSLRPALVTLDLMMPNQSGTDFYRNLVKDKDLRDTPIIVISGLPGRHLAVRKPQAVFDKPIDPDEFIAAVRKALGEEG
jgi:CheY-like chemotaxis protein